MVMPNRASQEGERGEIAPGSGHNGLQLAKQRMASIGLALPYGGVLGRPGSALQRLTQLVDSFPEIRAPLLEAMTDAHEKGEEVFDPVAAMRQAIDETRFGAFEAAFRADGNGPDGLLYQDAALLRERMAGRVTIPHVVLAAGLDSRWQALQAEVSGWSGHVVELDRRPCGAAVIAYCDSPEGWRLPGRTGPGVEEGFQAEELWFVSDRPLELTQAAEAVRGAQAQVAGARYRGTLLIRADEVTSAEQHGDVPPDTKIIFSLAELDLPRRGGSGV